VSHLPGQTKLTFLQAVANNEKGEFDAFYRLYAPMIRQWASRLMRDEAGADDVAQDVCLKLFAGALAKYLEDPRGFRGWLCTVVRHAALTALKKRKREAGTDVSAADDLQQQVNPNQLPPELEASLNEFRTEVAAAEERVRKRLRRPGTWLAYVRWRDRKPGETASQVGRELKLAPSAVYSAFHSVSRLLRAELGLETDGEHTTRGADDGLPPDPPPALPDDHR
jgi:RNA polymerase sigma factor (sigma-70 family)